MPDRSNGVAVTAGKEGVLFSISAYEVGRPTATFTPPRFEVNGVERGDFKFVATQTPETMLQHGTEELLTYREESAEPALTLVVAVREHENSPFIRFRYTLTSDSPAQLTKTEGKDTLRYFEVKPNLQNPSLTEIQLSHFDPVAHSYLPYRHDTPSSELHTPSSFVGPIAILHEGGFSVLVAYEHGADHPDSFFDYTLTDSLSLHARKGNYWHGYEISPEKSFQSVWFEAGAFAGNVDVLLEEYRRFFLEEVADNNESRKPYIFYNTWNYQERLKYFEGKPYLSEMNLERMLAEIEAAHTLGIEVFVIDTGWYHKTGDWEVDLERFPDGLKTIRQKLEDYGMKLGLWLNPIVAAQSSKVFLKHRDCVLVKDGIESFWGPIWETEESYGMCLASDYAESFIKIMVRLHEELGVTYFKWDAIGQYGCNADHHHHGTATNSPQERTDCYAYEMGLAMIRIVEEATKRAPGIIVDFDVTEGGRFVGLGFLSVGKYFLINNGPYFHDFNIPKTVKMEPDTINVFFYGGPARPRICRQSYRFDTVIPSILFLTHFLPDGPQLSQDNTFGALTLGGNGIWGDLVGMSEEEVSSLGAQLTRYKSIAQAATNAYPKVTGFPGSSPEIHEKIETQTGRGLITLFTVKNGKFTYVTQPLQNMESLRVEGADAYEILPNNRLKLTVDLERNGARVVTLH